MIREVSNNYQQLDLPGADITYYKDFLIPEDATALFEDLRKNVPWQQDDIKVFGKIYAQPRLTALFGEDGKPYSYSNLTMYPQPFNQSMLEVKALVEKAAGTHFTTCLLNLYRTGRDSNGWHADDEAELGRNPVIASISLGEERYFHLRLKKDKSVKTKLLLAHGSLLLMKGATQHNWQHQVPKTAKAISERINLTFRVIK